MGSPWKTSPILGLAIAIMLSACGGKSTSTPETKGNSSVTPGGITNAGEGTLSVRANGEERASDGFTTKDGWALDFNHIYVSLADINAYQTNPPFDPMTDDGLPKATVAIAIPGPKVVDIATGKNGETVLVGESPAIAGHFNALSWQMPGASDGPVKGYSMLMEGTATKDGKTLPFTVGIQEELAFVCGDFIGDERKGILTAGGTADLEATFHLDHFFGEGTAPSDDGINTISLGFAPLAALAQNNAVHVSSKDLKEKLSEADYQNFLKVVPSLGHVGEGHCREVNFS